MKRFMALVTIIAVLILSAIPVSGEGISVSSENGDKISLFNDISIEKPTKGNVITVLGDISVNDSLDGQVVAVFGDVTVNSEVSGQVVTVFGNTVLKDGSVVKGDVINIGSLSKAGGARVLGQEVRIFGDSMNLDITAIVYLRLVIMILFTIAVLIIGMLILLISKHQYTEIAKNIEKNSGRKLLLGILSFLGVSVLFLLLLVTLIAPVLYFVILVMSTITASMYFGRLILKTFSQVNSIYMEFVTGLITITLAKLLLIFLIPHKELLLGFILIGLLDVFIYSIGLGIHMDERFAAKNKF